MENFLIVDDDLRPYYKSPVGISHIDYSRFQKLEAKLNFRGISVKYVVRGKETYFLGGKEFEVCPGEFLVTSHQNEAWVNIDSPILTEGICLTLTPELIREVLQSYCRPEVLEPDYHRKGLEKFLFSTMFLENVYHSANTVLGQQLASFAKVISLKESPSRMQEEIFYQLSEAYVQDQRPVYKYFTSLSTARESTRKEILRRLLRARDYMNDNYSSNISCADIARLVTLSEFHFYRLFRIVFNMSPRQYIIKKRLETAAALITSRRLPISEIAIQVGFADLQSFSKSFRKHFGHPPMRLRS